jgi:hypothetical protein
MSDYDYSDEAEAMDYSGGEEEEESTSLSDAQDFGLDESAGLSKKVGSSSGRQGGSLLSRQVEVAHALQWPPVLSLLSRSPPTRSCRPRRWRRGAARQCTRSRLCWGSARRTQGASYASTSGTHAGTPDRQPACCCRSGQRAPVDSGLAASLSTGAEAHDEGPAILLARDVSRVTDEWFADMDRVRGSVGMRDPEPAPSTSEVRPACRARGFEAHPCWQEALHCIFFQDDMGSKYSPKPELPLSS